MDDRQSVNNNNSNPICKAPECQKTSVALRNVKKKHKLWKQKEGEVSW